MTIEQLKKGIFIVICDNCGQTLHMIDNGIKTFDDALDALENFNKARGWSLFRHKSEKLKKEIRWFAKIMNDKLISPIYRIEWKKNRYSWLLKRLHENLGRVVEIVSGRTASESEVISELAEMANVVMMIADKMHNERPLSEGLKKHLKESIQNKRKS